MVLSCTLFFVFAYVSNVLCIGGSCGTQPEVRESVGTAGCGCENLKRAAAVEAVGDRTASAEPAGKYTRGVNEREVQSQVICLSFIGQFSLLQRRYETRGRTSHATFH